MRASDPLGLELLTVMSHHVGTRNQQDRGLKSLTMDSKHYLFQVNRLLCILGLQVEIQRYHDLSHI